MFASSALSLTLSNQAKRQMKYDKAWTQKLHHLTKFIKQRGVYETKGMDEVEKEQWTWNGSMSLSHIKSSTGTQKVKPLAQWVYNQRSMYHKGKLTIDRTQRLNQIGMQWTIVQPAAVLPIDDMVIIDPLIVVNDEQEVVAEPNDNNLVNDDDELADVVLTLVDDDEIDAAGNATLYPFTDVPLPIITKNDIPKNEKNEKMKKHIKIDTVALFNQCFLYVAYTIVYMLFVLCFAFLHLYVIVGEIGVTVHQYIQTSVSSIPHVSAFVFGTKNSQSDSNANDGTIITDTTPSLELPPQQQSPSTHSQCNDTGTPNEQEISTGSLKGAKFCYRPCKIPPYNDTSIPSSSSRVKFAEKCSIVEVPHFSEYSPNQRMAIWAGSQELQYMAQLNTFEYQCDGHDLNTVSEETDFVIIGGELVHPSHAPQVSLDIDSQSMTDNTPSLDFPPQQQSPSAHSQCNDTATPKEQEISTGSLKGAKFCYRPCKIPPYNDTSIPSSSSRVKFAKKCSIVEVPHFSEYSPNQRMAIWASSQELHYMAQLNTFEYQYDGHDLNTVSEETDFVIIGGELVHPSHALQVSLDIDSQSINVVDEHLESLSEMEWEPIPPFNEHFTQMPMTNDTVITTSILVEQSTATFTNMENDPVPSSKYETNDIIEQSEPSLITEIENDVPSSTNNSNNDSNDDDEFDWRAALHEAEMPVSKDYHEKKKRRETMYLNEVATGSLIGAMKSVVGCKVPISDINDSKSSKTSRVTFMMQCVVTEIPSRREYSSKQMEAMYYSGKEKSSMKRNGSYEYRFDGGSIDKASEEDAFVFVDGVLVHPYQAGNV